MKFSKYYEIVCIAGECEGEKISINNKEEFDTFASYSLASDDYNFTFYSNFEPSMEFLKDNNLKEKYEILMLAQDKMFSAGLFENKYQPRSEYKLNLIQTSN